MLEMKERIRGCLLGGAVGDALGAPVEFDALSEIRSRYGPHGPEDMARAYGRVGAITDDTQMTMWTVEGLIRAWVRGMTKGICHVPSIVHQAYLRWLATQGDRSKHAMYPAQPDGWLVGVEDLHARRAPGSSCLSALESDRMGTPSEPINDSKGCGGVMRIAPVGFFGREPFELGCEIAALTHGHPTGYLAAGYLADLVRRLSCGEDLRGAIRESQRVLARQARHQETTEAIDEAVALAADGRPSAEIIETMGGGWIAEEALAISLYCALITDDFEAAVRLAVTHSGDSDSTGAITGAILGARDGASVIPDRWLADLEMREALETLADDMARVVVSPETCDPRALWERYPGT